MKVMKPTPDTPEFSKLTEALKAMLKVSKTEMQRRIEDDKTSRRTSGSESPSVSQ
jgi:hypothetical protein